MFLEIFNKIFITQMQLYVRQMVALCPLEPTKKRCEEKKAKEPFVKSFTLFFSDPSSSLALAIKVDPKSFSC